MTSTALLCTLLHKHNRLFGVTLTAQDIAAYETDARSGEAVLITRELGGGIDLRLVSRLEAQRMRAEGWT